MKISINNDEVKLTVAGVGLQGAPFTHADFTAAQLTALAFTHADFTGEQLSALAFTHADFTAAELTALAFTHDDFTATQLAALAFTHADFTATELAALAFTHADFTAAQLADLAFTHADFTAAQLSALAFTHADFTATELAALAFTHDDFTAAQLAALKGDKGDAFTHADFTAAQLTALAFTHADFTGEQLSALAFTHADFTAAELTALAFTHDDFTATQLAALAFTHADFTATELAALAFTHADFTTQQLADLAFTHADFTAAQLSALAFTHADFTAAELAALAFTHDDFTAAQLAALKGDKGDPGDLSAGGAIGGDVDVVGNVATTGDLNIDGDIVGHNLNSELSGFFIDSAREDVGDTLNPNYTNALAHFEKKGGTLTVTRNGEIVTGGNMHKVFESGSDTAQLNMDAADVYVIELTAVNALQLLQWNGSIGIGFSAEGWRCKGIKIEASTNPSGDYYLQGEVTGHAKNWYAVNRQNDGTNMVISQAIERIKITLTDPAGTSYWRINSIWAEDYNTSNNDYWLSAGGGQVYGNITAHQFDGQHIGDGSLLSGISTDNNYVDSAAFNTSDGKLTLGRSGSLGDLTVDLDGKYAESGHDHNTQDIVHAVVLDIGNNNGAVEWYELGTVTDNNGSLSINGILGSHTESRGRAHLSIRITNREGLDVAGAVYGNIGDIQYSEMSDIVVFDDTAAGKYRVFLKISRYGLTNFELRGSRNTTVTYDGTKITTDPANTYGAALFKLSEDDGQFIRVDTWGDLHVPGKIRAGGELLSGIVYPYETKVTRTAANNASDEWYRIYDAPDGNIHNVKFEVSDWGNNTQSKDEFLVSFGAYGMEHNIVRLPGCRYNTSKIVEVRTANPDNGSQLEIWVKVKAMTSANGGEGWFKVRSTHPVPNLSSPTTTEPSNDSVDEAILDFTSNDRQIYSMSMSGGIDVHGGINSDKDITAYNSDANANPRLSVGRDTGQNIQLSVGDQEGKITYKQDETDANDHNLVFDIESGSSGSKDYQFNVNGVTKTTINSTGVGIGTSSPDANLHIKETSGDASLKIFSGGTSNTAALQFGDTSTRAQIIGQYGSGGGGQLQFWTDTTGGTSLNRLTVSNTGNVTPGADNTQDLGSTTKRWANIYTGDLHLSNEGSTNEVDGTSGNWTIQEGENDLYIINNKNGKKFKFSLQEIS